MENRPRAAGIPLPGLGTALIVALGLLIGWMTWQAGEGKRQEQQVARLRDDLRDPDATLAERLRSIELWVREGRQAVPQLLRELDNPSPKVRAAIALALSRIRPPEDEALAALDGLLDDPEAEVRLGALAAWRSVVEFHEAAVGPHLPRILRSLDETDAELRNEALLILRRCADRPQGEIATPEVRAELIRLTQSSQPSARQSAATGIRFLQTGDADSIAALRLLLEDSTPEVRDEAFRSLTALGTLMVHEAAEALSSRDPGTQLLACRVLESLEEVAAPATNALRELLKSGESVEPALAALAAIGPLAEAAVPEVLRVLEESGSDPNSGGGYQAQSRAVRHGLALHCLAKIARDPSRVVPHMSESLTDSDLRVAALAGEALAALSPEAAAAEVPRLLAELDGADHSRTRSIVAALGGLEYYAAEAVPTLIELLDDPEPSIRWYAVETLGRLGAASANAVPALTAHLEAELARGNSSLAQLTLGALRHTAGRSPELERLTWALIQQGFQQLQVDPDSSTPEAQVLGSALRLLGTVAQGSEGSHQELRTIYELLSDPVLGDRSEWACVAALRSLAELRVRPEEIVDILLAAARDKSSMRAVALRGLGRFVQRAEQSVPLLIEALDSEDSQVRSAAALALGDLGGAARTAIPRLRAIAEAPLNLITIDGSLISSSLASDPASILDRSPTDHDDALANTPRRAARLSLARIEAAQ